MDSTHKRVKIFGYLDLFLTITYAAKLFIPQILLVASQEEHELQAAFPWIFNALVALVFLVLALSAVTLIQAMNPSVSKEERYKVAKFWVYVNFIGLYLLLFVLAALIIAWKENRGHFPAPFIVYILFKLASLIYIRFGTSVAVKEQALFYIPQPALVPGEAPQEQQRSEIRSRYYTEVVKNTEFDMKLQLEPYRGNGVAMPNCQCLAPQVME